MKATLCDMCNNLVMGPDDGAKYTIECDRAGRIQRKELDLCDECKQKFAAVIGPLDPRIRYQYYGRWDRHDAEEDDV